MLARRATVTLQQAYALKVLRRRWDHVGSWLYGVGGDCIMVQVRGETGMGMWLGIERDGHTHS